MTASTSLHPAAHSRPRTIGQWKRIPDFDARATSLSVKNEIRRNLLRAIERNDPLFPGVHGYEDSVIPQIVNALLSATILFCWDCAARRRAASSAG